MSAELLLPLVMFYMYLFPSVGVGVPFGMPPEPEDVVIQSAAPEECLAWFSLVKGKNVDPASKNPIEKFIANLIEHNKKIQKELQKSYTRSDGSSVFQVNPAASHNLNNHICFFLEELLPDKTGGLLRQIRAGAVIKYDAITDEQKVRFTNQLQLLLNQFSTTAQLPPISDSQQESKLFKFIIPTQDIESPVTIYGTWYDDYMVLSLDEKGLQNTLQRMKKKAGEPKWLSAAKASSLASGTRSSITYINVKNLASTIKPLLPSEDGTQRDDIRAILNIIGMENLREVIYTSFFTTTGSHTRTLLNVAPSAPGKVNLVRELTCGQLSSRDIQHIPSDVLVAFAYKCTPKKSVDAIQSQVKEWESEFEELNQATHDRFGVDFTTDILGALDGAVTLYAANKISLEYITLTVGVKKPETIEKVLKTIGEELRSEYDLEPSTYEGFTLYSIPIDSDIKMIHPWISLVQDKLVVTTSKSQMKRYIRQIKGTQDPVVPSLMTISQVSDIFKMDTQKSQAPFMIEYLNTTAMFETFYPLIKSLSELAAAQIPEKNIQTAVKNMYPPREIFNGVTGVDLTLWRSSETGLHSEHYSPWPYDQSSGSFIGGVGAGLCVPAVYAARGAARKMMSMNNMKNIMLGIICYHDVYKAFPRPYTVSKDGKPLLSWRVYLLPYLEETDLFNQFKTDEPWDSPHNKALISKMPSVYLVPQGNLKRESGLTQYVVPRDAETAFPGNKKIDFGDISDGSTNTVGLLEVAENKAVIWTKPDDLDVSSEFNIKWLNNRNDTIIMGCLDGSIQTFPLPYVQKYWMQLFHRNDGEALPDPDEE